MPCDIKPLSCDPKKLKGLSEKLIVRHWENNYSGALKRLNAIAVSSTSWTSPRRRSSRSTHSPL